MPEPISHALAALKGSYLVAGFIGAITSLSFITGITLNRAVIIILVGIISAKFATPAILVYLPKLDGEFTAWMVGIVSMPVLAGIFKIANLFEKNPTAFIKKEDKE